MTAPAALGVRNSLQTQHKGKVQEESMLVDVHDTA
jgi:hypothetical protein